MGYFTLTGGLILVTPLLSLLAMTVAGQNCSGKEPVIVPSVLVAKYGGPATATCHAQDQVEMIGWEATVGTKTEESVRQLDWSRDSMDWSLKDGIKCFTNFRHEQCNTHLPIVLYKIPESVSLLLTHTDSLHEGQQYELECEVESVAPVQNLTIIWYRGDTELEQSDLAQFTIEGDKSKDVSVKTNLKRTASRDDHAVPYSCAARLDLLTLTPIPYNKSNAVQLEVLYKPRIVSYSPNMTLIRGKTLELHCTADANPSPTYQWTHNNKILENKNTAALLIRSIQRDNAGVYQCTVSNREGGEVSGKMTVDVWYKPRIESSIQDTTLTEGETLELNCTADSNPSPTYQWRHNNKTLENENQATLLIESIQRAKGGIYECIASNPAGETSVKMTLDIWYEPRIESSIQDTTLTEGETLELNCTADSNPSPTYQWRHNNKTLENENQATLLIESIQRAKGGIYECIASNPAGETSVKMTLDIWYKPKIVSTIQDTSLTEGQTLQLNCEADSNPSPIYQWRHNNKTLENENKATLLIESIQQAKAGIYECILSNLAGETSVKMRVDISGDGNNLHWIAILLAIAIGVLLVAFIGMYRLYQKKKRPGKCWLTRFTAGTTQSRQETPLNEHPE